MADMALIDNSSGQRDGGLWSENKQENAEYKYFKAFILLGSKSIMGKWSVRSIKVNIREQGSQLNIKINMASWVGRWDIFFSKILHVLLSVNISSQY